jgi:hypothetical protein
MAPFFAVDTIVIVAASGYEDGPALDGGVNVPCAYTVPSSREQNFASDGSPQSMLETAREGSGVAVGPGVTLAFGATGADGVGDEDAALATLGPGDADDEATCVVEW